LLLVARNHANPLDAQLMLKKFRKIRPRAADTDTTRYAVEESEKYEIGRAKTLDL
jgi:hypothetical protein